MLATKQFFDFGYHNLREGGNKFLILPAPGFHLSDAKFSRPCYDGKYRWRTVVRQIEESFNIKWVPKYATGSTSPMMLVSVFEK